MVSSSSSSIHKSFKYDVFLSFRGEDTRTSFVDHLYHALLQKSIHTYKDDPRIKKGKNISDELIRAIQDSKFYIIVFSKNYASSSWCLDELVKIMENHRTNEHTAYPVFYDVEPSEVRKQSGAVAAAFAKLENEEAAGKWRDALKEASDLAGWELKKTVDGHEAKFIQKIVEELSLELRAISFDVDEKLVGMESRLKEIVSSLGTGFDDVRMIGIKGMGGSGKTTLARAVFDHISFMFEGKSFVENVREVSNASLSGLKLLQNQVLSDVLNDKGINVSSVYDGKHMMKRLMPDRKVLLVLDDVDHIDQLEVLAGEPNWFKPGSKIIITTRDEQVLVAHQVMFIHNVTLLSDIEGICLFSRYAFGKEIPILGYEELSRQVVRYAAGLPLTIRVLGSFLCGKHELEWVDSLDRLKTIPLSETIKKLELSYIGLEEDYKEIFLDIACILKGWRKCMAIKILESCGFHARNGLKVLEQKSLISINVDSDDEYVDMHDHIQELGRNIVRRSHPDKPHKHSRLWIDEEIEEILANDLGTKATRCIQFSNRNLSPHIVIKGLRKMKELRFLSMDFGAYTPSSNFDNIAISNFPNALRYLSLEHYPFRSLPETFQANKLVMLEMVDCRNIQLWEGEENKVVNKLKFLNLSSSMLSTLDLGLAPNLVELTLSSTTLKNLSDSICMLKHLKSLELDRCSLLANLPEDLGQLECLEKLDLSDTKINRLPHSISMLKHLKSLKLNLCVWLEKLPEDVGQIECLERLDLSYTKIKHLPDSICMLTNLKSLKLRFCCFLEKLPEDLGRLECLEDLTLSYTMIRYLPDSICMLKHLKSLELVSCSLLEKLHEDLGSLECLEKLSLNKCQFLQDVPNSIGKMKCLKYFHLTHCIRVEKLPEEFGSLTCIKELDIEGTRINQIPQSILLLKDVHIIGPRGLVLSCGLTSEIQTPECDTSYVRIHDNGMIFRISERPGKPIDKQLS